MADKKTKEDLLLEDAMEREEKQRKQKQMDLELIYGFIDLIKRADY